VGEDPEGVQEADGTYIRFDQNAAVLINDDRETEGVQNIRPRGEGAQGQAVMDSFPRS